MVSDSALCLQMGYRALGGLSDAKLFFSMFKGPWVDRGMGFLPRIKSPGTAPFPLCLSPAAAPGSLLTGHLSGPSGLDDTHPKTCKQTLLLSSALWEHPSSTTLLNVCSVLQKRLKKKKRERENRKGK